MSEKTRIGIIQIEKAYNGKIRKMELSLILVLVSIVMPFAFFIFSTNSFFVIDTVSKTSLPEKRNSPINSISCDSLSVEGIFSGTFKPL
jgi:hypothetical protein